MFMTTFPVGPFQCNCSVIADEATGDAVIVDPGDEADKILSIVKERGFNVKYLVHTHAHLDHIGATRQVREACGGDACLHKGDLPLYENIVMQGEFLGLAVDPVLAPVARFLEHGDTVEAGGLRLDVIHTPGHTPGSVCFRLTAGGQGGDVLFSGDTLFKNSIGRTDLWGGDYGQIMASLKERVLTLPADTLVISGHGPTTTIFNEKKSNPFLQD